MVFWGPFLFGGKHISIFTAFFRRQIDKERYFQPTFCLKKKTKQDILNKRPHSLKKRYLRNKLPFMFLWGN